MYLEQEQTDQLYNQINEIITSINEDKPLNMLNETDILIKSLNKEQQNKETRELSKAINSILTNPELLRQIKLNQRIKTEIETGIEYYSEDIGEDERIHYNQELEEILTNLQERIRKIIATIIKETRNELEL